MIIDNKPFDTFVLTPGIDVQDGTAGNDLFLANQDTLNPNDNLNGLGGNDIFDFAYTGNVPGANAIFAGFTLDSFEVFRAQNNSDNDYVVLDMSQVDSSLGLIVSENSLGDISFLNVQNIVNISVANTVDGDDHSLLVEFSAAAAAGDTTVNVKVDSSGLNDLVLAQQSDGFDDDDDPDTSVGTGIETLNLVAPDGTTIDEIDSNITNLWLEGSGLITVNSDLETSIRMIDASDTSGGIDVRFTNNAVGVNVIGGTGGDRIFAGGGNNSVSSGDGRDKILVQEGSIAGNQSFDGGNGNDVFDVGDGVNFNALDAIDGGDGTDELRIDYQDEGGTNNAIADADFAGVKSVEIVSFTNDDDDDIDGAVLGANAQAAGIREIQFDRDSEAGFNQAADDNINASAMTADLRWVQVPGGILRDLDPGPPPFNNPGAGEDGGDDTLISGSGNDFFNLFSFFDDGDFVDGNLGMDEIRVRGDTTLTGGELEQIEKLTMLRSNGKFPGDLNGNQYSITLNNTEAPDGGRLTLDGSTLQGDIDGPGPFAAETLFVNGAAATYNLTVNGGGAMDTITTGTGADIVSGGGGADTIVVGTGADRVTGGGAGDDIDLGADGDVDVLVYTGLADSVLSTGRDIVENYDATGEDLIDLNGVADEAGLEDVVFVGTYANVAAAQLDATNGSGDLQVFTITGAAPGGGDLLVADYDDDGDLSGDDLQIAFDLAGDGPDGQTDFVANTAAPANVEVAMPAEISLPTVEALGLQFA